MPGYACKLNGVIIFYLRPHKFLGKWHTHCSKFFWRFFVVNSDRQNFGCHWQLVRPRLSEPGLPHSTGERLWYLLCWQLILAERNCFHLRQPLNFYQEVLTMSNILNRGFWPACAPKATGWLWLLTSFGFVLTSHVRPHRWGWIAKEAGKQTVVLDKSNHTGDFFMSGI